MSYSVPPEIVSSIIYHILDAPPRNLKAEEPGVSTKPAWQLVQSLSLTSRSYRLLVLEAWFYRLFLKTPEDIKYIREQFPLVCEKWARELQCVQADTFDIYTWDLLGFVRLNTIRLDWLPSIMIPYWNNMNGDTERLPFANISSSITHLDIRGLRWPSPTVFKLVSQSFPDLRILKMRQNRIWCGLCSSCSVVRFQTPGPRKLVYNDGFGLPMHYARALTTLAHLEAVYIIIPDLGSGLISVSDEQDSNHYLWAGECDRCMQEMYDSGTFRIKRLDGEKSLDHAEKSGYLVYTLPPSLKKVEWRFLATKSNESND